MLFFSIPHALTKAPPLTMFIFPFSERTFLRRRCHPELCWAPSTNLMSSGIYLQSCRVFPSFYWATFDTTFSDDKTVISAYFSLSFYPTMTVLFPSI